MPKCAATRACSRAGSRRRRKVAVASTRRWARGDPPERLPHLSKRGLCPAQGFRRELTLCGQARG